MPVYPHLAILGVSISCRQYWPYKGFWKLALIISHPRNSGAGVGYRSYRCKLGADMMREKMEGEALLSWHWSVNSGNNERFSHFQLRAHPPYPGFFAKTLTKHLQLHLLCPGGCQFENGIGRAFGPNGLV